MKNNCEHCKYYLIQHKEKLDKTYGLRKYAWGECHRFPPHKNYDTNGPSIGVSWLEVNYDDYCGEYEES